ncbi:uncharacterized protein BN660_01251 [Clostridium sp. CAG:448]|nr:uncharacterized protein BN660_01251 [Clostridium sp. CAG:448]
MILASLALPSTPMELVRRLTEQAVTPSTAATAFSTRALHAAQLIPVTLNCFILTRSFLSGICHAKACRHHRTIRSARGGETIIYPYYTAKAVGKSTN